MRNDDYIDGLQAITTRYLGPNNRCGSRIKATASGGSITIPVDNRWNQDENHRAAAQALMQRMNWEGKLFCGGMPNSNDRVFVQVSFQSIDTELAHTISEHTEGRYPSPPAMKRLLDRLLNIIR